MVPLKSNIFFTCYIYNRMLTIEAVIDEIALEGHYHLERRVASSSIVLLHPAHFEKSVVAVSVDRKGPILRLLRYYVSSLCFI